MARDTLADMEPECSECECPACTGDALTPDHVVLYLTIAVMARNWDLVMKVTEDIQDNFGSLPDSVILSKARDEVQRAALLTPMTPTTPIEA
jgi:hypothetical protein